MVDTQKREFFSPEKIQHNLRVVTFCRTFMAIVGGATAGIMGLTNLAGFAFYAVLMGLVTLGIYVKANGSAGQYFVDFRKLALEGFTQGMLSYVLFWTLFFDVVYIFK